MSVVCIQSCGEAKSRGTTSIRRKEKRKKKKTHSLREGKGSSRGASGRWKMRAAEVGTAMPKLFILLAYAYTG